MAVTSESDDQQFAVFFSHSSEDKRFVRRIADELSQYKIKVWLDEVDISIGQKLGGRIRDGIAKSDFFIIALSQHAIQSPWVKEELKIVEKIENEEGRQVIVPLLLDDIADPVVDELIGDRVFADFREPQQFLNAIAAFLWFLGVFRRFARPNRRRNRSRFGLKVSKRFKKAVGCCVN